MGSSPTKLVGMGFEEFNVNFNIAIADAEYKKTWNIRNPDGETLLMVLCKSNYAPSKIAAVAKKTDLSLLDRLGRSVMYYVHNTTVLQTFIDMNLKVTGDIVLHYINNFRLSVAYSALDHLPKEVPERMAILKAACDGYSPRLADKIMKLWFAKIGENESENGSDDQYLEMLTATIKMPYLYNNILAIIYRSPNSDILIQKHHADMIRQI